MATLRRIILTYTSQESIKNEWNKHLRLIQFVYNNTVHTSTGFTPFYLTHGRHPRTPLVVAKENNIFEHYKSPPQQFAIELQERLNLAFDMVDEHFSKKLSNNKENAFKIGQKVLVFNQALTTKKKPRKLMFDWIGPFIITKINSRSSVDLKNINSNKVVLNVHISRIKRFEEQSNQQ
ncbi:hypothetical protein K501DRAFT_307621 [Backusella circina FSU 941]|nr:hypothetical protein K501DRAFT_307621 [Backusella circina FSU 941]